MDGGRPQEAADVAAGAVDPTGPAAAALLHVQAEAASRTGAQGAEIAALQRLTALSPGDWRGWSALGNALARTRDWTAAAAALSRATELVPRDPELALALATSLEQAQQFDRALEELQRLSARHPDRTDIAVASGRVLAELGRLDPAEQTYRAVLARHPRNGDAAYELGLLLERSGRHGELRDLLADPRLAAMPDQQRRFLQALVAIDDEQPALAREHLDAATPERSPVRWHRLQAKVSDRLGDADGAFAAAVAMNQAMRRYEEWRQRAAAFRRQIRQVADVITPEWCASVPRLPPGDRRAPVFLVGFPRSGTTLLDTFLMGHPAVRVLEEVPLLHEAELVIGGVLHLPNCPERQLDAAREAYYARLDRHVPADFDGAVVDKLPLNMLNLPVIRALFPEAKVVFAQRHPCDAVLSAFMQSFVMNDAMASFLDIQDAADLYDASLASWTRSVAGFGERPLKIVYEELVAAPEKCLRPLVAELGLDWNDKLLAHRETASARGLIMTASYDQVTKPLNSAASGRWRRYHKQLAPVLPVLLPWARRLGYAD
jgi:Flp pilus assembly protein TadD